VSGPRELRIQIGAVRVVGGSTIQARRIADALPVALERALAGLPAPTPGPADQVAAVVADRIRRDAGAAGAEVGP
jgi:hypothetical protein